MGQVNITKDFTVIAPTSRPATPVLPVNANRKFLQVINNGSASNIRIKFDQNFLVPADEKQAISFSGLVNAGTWLIKDWLGTPTSALSATASASDVQTALQALGSIGSGNCTVTGTMAGGFTVEFTGTLAQTAMPGLMSVVSSLTNTTGQQNCVQNIVWSASPTAGTFKLQGSAGNKTTALNYNDNGTTIAAALNALPEINGGVSGAVVSGTTIAVTFGAPLANQPVALLNVTDNSLTNNSTLVSAVQQFFAEPEPQQGTYQLSFQGQTTTPIPFNANAATIQAALIALSNIGPGDVVVTGINLLGGFVVTFGGALGNQAVGLIAVIDGGLHADLLQEPQKRFGDVEIYVRQTTAGVGPVAVTPTISYAQPGIAPLNISGAVSLVIAGQAPVVDGQIIQPGTNAPFSTAVPIGALYLIGDAGNIPVTILEGE